MKSYFAPDVVPFNLNKVLEHAVKQYDRYLEDIDDQNELIPACAVETKEATTQMNAPHMLIGAPDAVILNQLHAFLKNKGVEVKLLNARLAVNKSSLAAAQLTNKDEQAFLFILHKKLQELSTVETDQFKLSL